MKHNVTTERKLNNSRALRIVKKNISGWLLMMPMLIVFCYIIWRPIILAIVYSFFDLQGFNPTSFVGLKNYKDVLSDTLIMQAMWNTAKFVLWSLIISFPIPLIVAFMMNEVMHGKEAFKFSIFFPSVLPGMAISLIWAAMYDPGSSGLLNTILYKLGIDGFEWLQSKKWVIPLMQISMAWGGIGSTALIYISAMQGIDNEIYEAARLDGAGFFTRIRVVLLPHISGILLLMLVRHIIGTCQIMEEPLLMTGGGPNNASMTMGLQMYRYAFIYFQTDKALAYGGIMFAILMILTMGYHKLDKKIND